MTELTIRQIKDAQATYVKNGGVDDDSLQAKYYARPVSYYLTWLFSRTSITPNQITLLAVAFAVAGCFWFTYGWYTFGAVLLNVGHLLDYVDGTLAKATGKVSKFGAFLDRSCDEVVETIIPVFIGIALINTDIIFPVIGVGCAIFHLWGVIVSLQHDAVFGKTAVYGKSSWLVRLGVNVKSLAVPGLLVLSFIPYGLIVFLVGFLVLTIGEFAYKVTTPPSKDGSF